MPGPVISALLRQRFEWGKQSVDVQLWGRRAGGSGDQPDGWSGDLGHCDADANTTNSCTVQVTDDGVPALARPGRLPWRSLRDR